MSDGFVAAVGTDTASLVRIRPRGTRTLTHLANFAPDEMAVAPGGRTVALLLNSRHTSASSVATVDLGTGKRLGLAALRGHLLNGMAWVGPSRLLVRDTPFRSLPMRVLDRRARPVGTWLTAGIPNSQGSRLSALGGDALVYGWGRRLTVIPRSGTPFVAGSLSPRRRRAPPGVPGARFAAGAERTERSD